jgi:hypothetical protein
VIEPSNRAILQKFSHRQSRSARTSVVGEPRMIGCTSLSHLVARYRFICCMRIGRWIPESARVDAQMIGLGRSGNKTALYVRCDPSRPVYRILSWASLPHRADQASPYRLRACRHLASVAANAVRMHCENCHAVDACGLKIGFSRFLQA